MHNMTKSLTLVHPHRSILHGERNAMAKTAERPSGQRGERLSHVDLIQSVADGVIVPPEPAEVLDSWRRCTIEHHINPDRRATPHIITESELRTSRERLGKILDLAQEEIDRLYAIVSQENYVVLFCDTEGIAIRHRGNPAMADQFRYWGIWVGGVWSEEIEGTNGIGTCITEQKPIIVHRDQHFRTRHIGLSCLAAPIFDATGRLAAVLDISSMTAPPSDRSHAMALAATTVSARAIEERVFRDCYSQAWIVAAVPADESGPALLLAVDVDRRVVGADRVARLAFALDDKILMQGLHLSRIFAYDSSLFPRTAGDDVAATLRRVGSGDSWRALITAPGPKVWRGLSDKRAHLGPRISMLGTLPIAEQTADIRGGLAPGITRRISQYIDSHIGENISLEAMAEMAGLSVFHFSRAFRQATGVAPHGYLLQRRIEHAAHLLSRTELPLSEIALAVGFSDHSHFARHFRRHTGTTPSVARWQQR
jgi:AraC-like DNA-binding protein